MSDQEPLPPPGWYDDPQFPHLLRWWDGQRWTAQIQERTPGAGAWGTTTTTATGPELADFGVRFAAWLLDTLVIMVVGFVVVGIGTTVLVLSASSSGDPSAVGYLVFGLTIFLAVIVTIGYWVLFEGGRHGQTIGKWAMGIRVTGEDRASTIGYGRAAGRALVKQFLSGAIFYIGFLWMLWDAENRTWHDYLASTRVVRITGDKPSFGQLVGDAFARRS